jgi:hypothetical protein
MRKTRVGAALLAVALLLELMATLRGTTAPVRPSDKQGYSIQSQDNDNDNDRENEAQARELARWRELERALKSAPPAAADRGKSAATAPGPAPVAGDRALPSVYDPDWSQGKFAHFSAGELATMAQRCELRWQLPPFNAAGPSPNGADYDRVLATAREKYRAALTALYREAGGASAEALPLRALEDGVRGLEVADPIAVHRRLADERASSAATAEGTIYERFLRLQLSAGDDFEAALAEAVGAAQAQAWRESAGPKLTVTGCDPDHALFRSTR